VDDPPLAAASDSGSIFVRSVLVECVGGLSSGSMATTGIGQALRSTSVRSVLVECVGGISWGSMATGGIGQALRSTSVRSVLGDGVGEVF